MDMDAADAAFAQLGEAADISLDLVGAAFDAIPGIGEVLLAAEVCMHMFSTSHRVPSFSYLHFSMPRPE